MLFYIEKIGYYNNYIKKRFSCFILNSQFLNLIFLNSKTTQPIYTILYLDDSSKPTKLVNHCEKNVSIVNGIHKKNLSHTTTLLTCSCMGQKIIATNTFLNNKFNE